MVGFHSQDLAGFFCVLFCYGFFGFVMDFVIYGGPLVSV